MGQLERSWEDPKDGIGTGEASPDLSPRILINQWMEVFDLIAPDTLHVFKYYGGKRKETKKRGESSVPTEASFSNL